MTRTKVMVSLVALVLLAGAQLASAGAVPIVNPSSEIVPLTLEKLNANETTLFSETFDANAGTWQTPNTGTTREPVIDQTAHAMGPSQPRVAYSVVYWPRKNPGSLGPLHIDCSLGEVNLYFRIHFADPAVGQLATTHVRLYNTDIVNFTSVRIDPAATGNGGIFLYGMPTASGGTANCTANVSTNGAAMFTGTQTRDYRLNIVRAANGTATLTLHYHDGSDWVSGGSYTTMANGTTLHVPESFDYLEIYYTNSTTGSLDNRSFVDQVMVTQEFLPRADAPTIDPAGGVYPTDQTAIISAQEGAEIWYTIDGSTPSQGGATSILYDGTPIAISGMKKVLKARAYVEGMVGSMVTEEGYYVVPEENHYTAPAAALTIDGNLNDWPASATWSAPFVQGSANVLDSTTKAKFTWNDAGDVLYIAVETNEPGGGTLTLGMTKNPNVAVASYSTTNNLECTQIDFSYDVNELGNVYIDNWIGGVETGVVAGCTYDAGTGIYTYEIAHPFRSDWVNGTGDQTLSADEVVYLYSILSNDIGSMNLTYEYDGKSAFFYLGAAGISYSQTLLNTWVRTAGITLEAAAVADIPGDANHDSMVDVGDLGILAANYGTLSGATWEQGDFNGDGAVDVGDLGILAANYGTGVEGASDFSTDYAKAFGTAAQEEETGSSLCSGLGLPLVVGLLLMGLCLMIKMEE